MIIAVVIVLAGLAGAYFYFQQTPDVVQSNPDVSVGAKELIAAFQEDTAIAKEKFVDKVVEVTGTVKSIHPEGTIMLGEVGSASDVVAGLDRRHLDDVEKVKVGSVARIQGICSGYTTGGTADPADMLSDLGTTVQLRSAGVKFVQ